MKRVLVFYMMHTLVCSHLKAQAIDVPPPEDVKSIMMENRNSGRLFSRIARVGDNITFSFDILRSESQNLYYTFVLADADWNPSDLNKAEYIDGFEENVIEHVQFSENTLQLYVHYRISLPTADCSLTRSGNYYLIVYEDEPDQALFTYRFGLYLDYCEVIPNERQARSTKKKCENEQLHIQVRPRRLPSDLFFDQSRLVVVQNHDMLHSTSSLPPTHHTNQERTYIVDFEAGNEFRVFSTQSTAFGGQNVVRISLGERYEFELDKEELRKTSTYVPRRDLNGAYVLLTDQTDEWQTRADYVDVDFGVETFLLPGESLYVIGAMNEYRLVDPLTKAEGQQLYTTRLRLKQGYYNYRYVICKEGVCDMCTTEGSHFLTQNHYTILFYCPDAWGSHHLVGVFETLDVTKDEVQTVF